MQSLIPKIQQRKALGSSHRHAIKQMDKNTSPITLRTRVEGDYMLHPHDPSLIDTTDVP